MATATVVVVVVVGGSGSGGGGGGSGGGGGDGAFGFGETVNESGDDSVVYLSNGEVFGGICEVEGIIKRRHGFFLENLETKKADNEDEDEAEMKTGVYRSNFRGQRLY